jgi:hypothetical protein
MKLRRLLCALIVGGGLGAAWSARASPDGGAGKGSAEQVAGSGGTTHLLSDVVIGGVTAVGIICFAVVAVCRRHSDVEEARAKLEAKQLEVRLEIVRLALLRLPDWQIPGEAAKVAADCFAATGKESTSQGPVQPAGQKG